MQGLSWAVCGAGFGVHSVKVGKLGVREGSWP